MGLHFPANILHVPDTYLYKVYLICSTVIKSRVLGSYRSTTRHLTPLTSESLRITRGLYYIYTRQKDCRPTDIRICRHAPSFQSHFLPVPQYLLPPTSPPLLIPTFPNLNSSEFSIYRSNLIIIYDKLILFIL